jgi:hypothetical protein
METQKFVLELADVSSNVMIFRTAIPTGGWEYHLFGSYRPTDVDASEDGPPWTEGPFETLEVAQQAVDKNGEWCLFTPIKVHFDFLEVVWRLVVETSAKLPEYGGQTAFERSRWRHLCGAHDGTVISNGGQATSSADNRSATAPLPIKCTSILEAGGDTSKQPHEMSD